MVFTGFLYEKKREIKEGREKKIHKNMKSNMRPRSRELLTNVWQLTIRLVLIYDTVKYWRPCTLECEWKFINNLDDFISLSQ
jgi:hypothetical protein